MTMAGETRSGTPKVGDKVLTADGEELGTIKEVRSASFKIDASLQPDYWLPVESLASASGDAVRLSITKDQLDDTKVEPPPDAGVQL